MSVIRPWETFVGRWKDSNDVPHAPRTNDDIAHLLPYRAETAIAAREQSPPHGELSPHDGSPRGAIPERPRQPRPLGGVEGALAEVPYATAYGTEGEGSAYVLDYPVGTWIAVGYRRIPHCLQYTGLPPLY